MNKSPLTGLHSQVARRLFFLFLLAALLPTGGLALIAYRQVGDMLIDLNYQRLQQDAKSLGMSLVQRLMWREETLRYQLAAAAAIARYKPGELDALLWQNKEFRSLEIAGPEKFITLAPPQLNHLRRSKVLMQLLPDGEPVMTTAISGSSDYLQVRLDTVTLWTDEYAGERYCILTLAGQPLYCSPGLSVPAREGWSRDQAGQSNSGVFAWQVEGEDHLAAYWHVPLQASFAHEGFVVVVSAARNDALAALTQFRQVFPAIVLLAMAVAALFAIGQIRRQMLPLDRLEKHTRQLAQGNFANRVEIAGNDEFASLADSFNRMSDNLNHKFHLLQALGELDRAILSAAEMDSVIRLLLQHAPLAVSCDHAGVLRFDGKGQIQLWTLSCGAEATGEVCMMSLEAQGAPHGNGDEPWFTLDLATAEAQSLRHFVAQGATQAIVFPARVGKRFDSALVLAYREQPRETEEIVQAGRSLADRLAAAAFSISWGDKLYHQAHFDALTGLPNRALLRDRVDHALLRAERESQVVALMLIDLDKFKDVNDSLGHSAGDTLLVSCARQLRKIARHTDTVARLGGDEFVVLIPDLPRAGATAIVDRIASELGAELARPIDLAGQSISASASIGIAFYPDNGAEIEELMKNADAAMYAAKREQHGSHRFYSDWMNVEIKVRFEMTQDLRKAMDRKEFFLVYQPKIQAATGRIVGAEALIRWASPRLGLVSPGQFIPLVDDIGLGASLGEWVIDTACAQMAAWDAQGLPPIAVSVNVSPAQFSSNEIVLQVRTALARNALAAPRLELEILESMAMGESGNISDTLKTLRGMGINIAIDDFGTGYSSLVYLTRLQANILKIDQGFITDLLTDSRKQAIVGQIISLAQVLDYQVVAEGVEEKAQAHMLTAMGCDLFQGYFFSKPLEPAAFVEFQIKSAAKPLLIPKEST